MEIENDEFRGNTAGYSGGGLWTVRAKKCGIFQACPEPIFPPLIIKNTIFENNNAQENEGGAVLIDGLEGMKNCEL